jgi:predicted metal-binding membrane protein
MLLYGRVVRQAERKGQIANASDLVAAFATGYLTSWDLFSILAVTAQWGARCAALMLLPFVGGVMNLAWIADLSLLVLAEKFLPRGERLSVALGVLVMIAGTGLVASAVAGQRE